MTIPDIGNPERADYIASIIQAFKGGSEIERAHRPAQVNSIWTPDGSPDWNFEAYDYRIAEPKPTHVPFSFETAPEIMKVRQKSDGNLFAAVAHPDAVAIGSGHRSDLRRVEYAALLRDFEQLSGEPCGTTVEGEDVWPKYAKDETGQWVWRFNSERDGVLSIMGGEPKESGCNWSGVFKDYGQITATEAAKLTGGKL